jgi:hypothetical protein
MMRFIMSYAFPAIFAVAGLVAAYRLHISRAAKENKAAAKVAAAPRPAPTDVDAAAVVAVAAEAGAGGSLAA